MFTAMRFAVLILLLTWATPAFSQSTNDVEALTKKEQAARDKAENLEKERIRVLKDVDTLKKSLAKTAQETQTIESDLTRLERDTEILVERETNLSADIEKNREQYISLLAALQKLEAAPPPTLVLTPRNAKRASRAGGLMTTLSTELQSRAESLTLSLTALDVTRTQLGIKKKDLLKTQSRLNTEMKSLNRGLTEKANLEIQLTRQKETAAAEAERLAAESKSLLELIAKLEAEAAKIVPRQKPGSKAAPKVIFPEGTKRFAEAKGAMIRPVSGKIIKSFGRGEKGITFTGRADGKVLAPYAGRVEFSGPFKNYDNVVILNVGDGYFVLLTGLEELYIDAGDNVRRGEPVGALPNRSNTELYIELRRNGSPVDPAPWLAASEVKSG